MNIASGQIAEPVSIDIVAAQTLANVTTLGTITNVVHVDDNAGALTVDGAVTVTGAVTAVADGIAQPAQILTNPAANDDTQGLNQACKAVLIRAHTINTGLVWVDFGAEAIEIECYPLAAGDAISVPLTNTNLIHCLFKVANEKVTVIYTN